MSESISQEDLEGIIEEAKRAALPETSKMSGTASTKPGACVSVVVGLPDSCHSLTQRECAYVDSALKAKSAGSAQWFPGSCKF